jgi:hypothetical protein
MLFCQLGHADSLREICNGLACCLGKLVHLGIAKAPNKSTLSYANQHRPAALYQDLFYAALARFCQQQGLGVRKRKFRFRNKLLSLDSTTISLCLSIFPWARCRHHKGGVKAHVLLDHDDYLPRYVLITEARSSDVRMAHAFALPPGSIVAMDRGYVDFRLFARWTKDGVFFVTRPLQHTVFEVVQSRPVPKNSTIRSDQTIRFNSEWAQRHGFKLPLRRISFWNEEQQREIVLLSNHFGLAASTLAAIYKERWEIELFFKALKQNLRIKVFFGTSENAVKTQLWIAISIYLLVAIVKKRLDLPGSLYTFLQVISVTLFEKMPISQALQKKNYNNPQLTNSNQLILFDF